MKKIYASSRFKRLLVAFAVVYEKITETDLFVFNYITFY